MLRELEVETANRDPELPPVPDYAELRAGSALLGRDRHVALWGGVVECEHGWRAGFAYPREIFVPSLAPEPDETAAELEEYGVPFEVLGAHTIGMALDAVAERAV